MSTVLIVDDEEGVRESINILLTSDGHHVVCANDGRQALEHLNTRHIDLVLTDIRMPEMNGLSLLKAIQAKWKNDIPVIIVTE
jgi:two-component system OmpR family response regulator